MTVAQLEKCTKALFALARARGITEIASEDDGYWTVTSPDWRDMYREPTPGVGSFCDDESGLTAMLQNPDRAGSVDFERVAHYLRLLSDQLSDPPAPATAR